MRLLVSDAPSYGLHLILQKHCLFMRHIKAIEMPAGSGLGLRNKLRCKCADSIFQLSASVTTYCHLHSLVAVLVSVVWNCFGVG